MGKPTAAAAQYYFRSFSKCVRGWSIKKRNWSWASVVQAGTLLMWSLSLVNHYPGDGCFHCGRVGLETRSKTSALMRMRVRPGQGWQSPWPGMKWLSEGRPKQGLQLRLKLRPSSGTRLRFGWRIQGSDQVLIN